MQGVKPSGPRLVQSSPIVIGPEQVGSVAIESSLIRCWQKVGA